MYMWLLWYKLETYNLRLNSTFNILKNCVLVEISFPHVKILKIVKELYSIPNILKKSNNYLYQTCI